MAIEPLAPIARTVTAPPAAPSAPGTRPYRDILADTLDGRRATLNAALAALSAQADDLAAVAASLVGTLRGGCKVLVAGNGGSAAEAQHFAAELVGRFQRERAPYAALALTTDTATLTAVANDYGYAAVFARQVRAFGQRGDLLLAFSTSGESENLLRAAAACRERQVGLVALTGARPSRLGAAADLALRVPSTETAVVQELHKILTHVLCDLVEAELVAWVGEAER
ncbi:MAG TPA: SIS domain-containing protein [Chloroflexota bacterium]|jgi:D-sedoheptulose 7-phosphate isomerase